MHQVFYNRESKTDPSLVNLFLVSLFLLRMKCFNYVTTLTVISQYEFVLPFCLCDGDKTN